MEDKHIPIEKLKIENGEKMSNKYQILSAAAKLARRWVEMINQGQMEKPENLYLLALKKILNKEVIVEEEEE